MANTPAWWLTFLLLFSTALAVKQPKSYALCQYPTAKTLEGCPKGTIIVGKNSSKAHFHTIQSAIQSLPNDTSSQTILILPGNYTEQVNITRHAPLTILGQTKDPKDRTQNTVIVWWAAANYGGSGLDNAVFATFTVAPNFNASLTGSGPTGFPVPADTPLGSIDFRAYNLDIYNEFAPRAQGQSLAVAVSRANAGFYHSGVYSYQDTVYIGKLGNTVFYESEIAGQTDFLYGFGTAWVEKSLLTLRGCGGGIIAWKGTNTTDFANKYGCYVSNSEVRAANSSIATTIAGKCSLGRPWNAQHRSVYINTYLDGSILPAGYTPWTNDPLTNNFNNYTIMAEYNSTGPGFNLAARLAGKVTIEFNQTTVRPYLRAKDVFITPTGAHPDVAWIDQNLFKV